MSIYPIIVKWSWGLW